MKKKYNIPQMRFICDYHPEIVVDSVEILPLMLQQFDGESPAAMCCFETEQGTEDYDNDEMCEGVYLKITFHDEGYASFAKRGVEFNGTAWLSDHETWDAVESKYAPGIAYPKTVRKGESATVCVPFIIRKFDEEGENEGKPTVYDMLAEHGASFSVSDIVIANPFVGMRFSIEGAVENKDGRLIGNNIEMHDVEYIICPEHEHTDAVDPGSEESGGQNQ